MIPNPAKTCAELGIGDASLSEMEHLRFYDVRTTEQMKIYGVIDECYNGIRRFVRIPMKIAESVSIHVRNLSISNTGGRVRFSTSSPYIAIKTTAPIQHEGINCNKLSMNGFDLYVKQNGKDTFRSIFPMPAEADDGFSSIVRGLGGGMKEVTINFPLHRGVQELYIGLDETSELLPHPGYRLERPVLYYGSSITQGIGASRPGMAYPTIISRKLDTNYTNLGLSGNCKAEDNMIDYLSSLDCSVFVLDYDHNAPSAEHLKNTHEKLYLAFRKTHPDTPVIMVSKPDINLRDNAQLDRRDIIRTTYENARRRGEKVLFVDGYSLFAGEMREDCTVDGCHPNDLGFSRMADVIGKAVDFALTM